MIKTEMVAMRRPETISSYEELLEKPEVRPLWLTNRSDHLPFKHAAPESAAGRIWHRAQKLGMDSSFMTPGDGLRKEVVNIMNQKAVWFLLSYGVKPLITNFCAASREEGKYLDVNPWARVDGSTPETLVGPVTSESTRPELAIKYNRLCQSQFEHYLVENAFKELEFCLVRDDGSKSVSDCVANVIVYPDYDIRFPDILHYERLFRIACFSLIVCSLILFMELLLFAVCGASLSIPSFWTLG